MSRLRALQTLIEELRRADYRFVTPTPATIGRNNARAGNETARDLAGVFGWSRAFEPGLVPERMVDLLDEADLLDREDGLLRSKVRVSSLGHTLYVHSAYPTVSANSVFFGPDTYRFVGAVEARLAQRATPIRHAVDIGCGAGPGGIAVAQHELSAEVTLVDINDTALLYAAANAAAAEVANVVPVRSDLLSGVDGAFDLIVSNPPYLNDPLARAYRHGGGSFGEGLSVRIAEEAAGRLAPGGELILYTGVAMVGGADPFLRAIASLLDHPGLAWTYREIDPDVFGEELETEAYAAADRIAAIVLTLTRAA